MRTEIIYEDKEILVARKPAGLAAQTARVGQADMVSELKNYLAVKEKGKNVYLGVIHRLDQPVEGLLVFAKEKSAAAALTKQLSCGILNKQYYAVICGQPTKADGELVDYLYKNAENKAQVSIEGDAHFGEAKKAILQYRILQTVSTENVAASQGKLSLAQIQIETGRFHQIRAQMAHAGMPLLGDSKYGSEESIKISADLGIRNVALCASDITLQHPKTGKKLEFHVLPQGQAFAGFKNYL